MGPRLLAIDTSTEVMAVGVCHGPQQWCSVEPGGAQTSARLIPCAMGLLQRAGISAAALDAVAFGAGPGAFTGLRSACSVAQGLAFGLKRPAIAVDSLMIVAEDARAQLGVSADTIWVAMDARMDEIYAGHYRWSGDDWQVIEPPALWAWPALAQCWVERPPANVAGTALKVFADRLLAGTAPRCEVERDRAGALLAVARRHWASGLARPADQALPVYLRDKVALTTTERDAAAARRDGARP